jgi:hypothetical protein
VAAAFRLENHTLVLAANLAEEPASLAIPVAGRTTRELYASPKASLDGKSLRAELPALGVGVWDVR